MVVAVLLKQVPDTTAKIGISGNAVDQGSISKWAISPYDEYALESAIKLKEEGAGEICAITCGPQRASKILTEAAAVGADSLVHIQVDSFLDSTQTQELLSAAVRRTGSEVVLCGKQSADMNSGSTGPGVATQLGFSCVGVVSNVSFTGGGFSATRLGPNGLEEIEVPAPCVFTFDKGDSELRRPNVRGIMMAKKKNIETLTPEDLGIDLGSSRINIESHSHPPQKPPGQKFEGANSVPIVVKKLRDEANVI